MRGTMALCVLLSGALLHGCAATPTRCDADLEPINAAAAPEPSIPAATPAAQHEPDAP